MSKSLKRGLFVVRLYEKNNEMNVSQFWVFVCLTRKEEEIDRQIDR